MDCKNCGNKLKKTDKFCNNCGKKVTLDESNVAVKKPKKKVGALPIVLIVLGIIIIWFTLVFWFLRFAVTKISDVATEYTTQTTEGVYRNNNEVLTLNDNKYELINYNNGTSCDGTYNITPGIARTSDNYYSYSFIKNNYINFTLSLNNIEDCNYMSDIFTDNKIGLSIDVNDKSYAMILNMTTNAEYEFDKVDSSY